LLRRLLAAGLVEREHQTLVDRARRLEQLELLLECGQQLRRGTRAHDFGRVPVEREHRRREPPRLREIAHETQHGLMAEMDPVERADRHRAGAALPRDLAGIAIDPHERAVPWPTSTTDGFTPAPRRSYTARSAPSSSITANGPEPSRSPMSAGAANVA